MKKIFSAVISIFVLSSMLMTGLCSAYTPVELDEVNLEVNQGFCRDITFVLGDANSDRAINANHTSAVSL